MAFSYLYTNVFLIADTVKFDNSALADCPESQQTAKITSLPPNLASPTFFARFGKVYSKVYLRLPGAQCRFES